MPPLAEWSTAGITSESLITWSATISYLVCQLRNHLRRSGVPRLILTLVSGIFQSQRSL
jgi:hypothetical protein